MIFQIAAGVFLGGVMLVSLLWSLNTVHKGETEGKDLSLWPYWAGLLPMLFFIAMLIGWWN